jgi:hypothetical protein
VHLRFGEDVEDGVAAGVLNRQSTVARVLVARMSMYQPWR